MAKQDRVAALKKEIGERLRELREARSETLRDVAERVKGEKEVADHGVISKIERGLSNPSLDVFFDLLLSGYKIEFAELCSHWASADKAKDKEERAARVLLERLLREGATARKGVLKALKIVQADASNEHGHKPGE